MSTAPPWTTTQERLMVQLRLKGLLPREIGPLLDPPRSKEAVRVRLGQLGVHVHRSATQGKASAALRAEIAAALAEAPRMPPYGRERPLEWGA